MSLSWRNDLADFHRGILHEALKRNKSSRGILTSAPHNFNENFQKGRWRSKSRPEIRHVLKVSARNRAVPQSNNSEVSSEFAMANTDHVGQDGSVPAEMPVRLSLRFSELKTGNLTASSTRRFALLRNGRQPNQHQADFQPTMNGEDQPQRPPPTGLGTRRSRKTRK